MVEGGAVGGATCCYGIALLQSSVPMIMTAKAKNQIIFKPFLVSGSLETAGVPDSYDSRRIVNRKTTDDMEGLADGARAQQCFKRSLIGPWS